MMIMIINFGLAFNQTISELRTYQIAHYTDHTSSVVCMLSATPRNAHFLQMCVGLFLICCIPISIPPLSSLYLPVSPPPSCPQLRSCFSWLPTAIIIVYVSLNCWCFSLFVSRYLSLSIFFSLSAVPIVYGERTTTTKKLWSDCLCVCVIQCLSNMIWKWERKTYTIKIVIDSNLHII